MYIIVGILLEQLPQRSTGYLPRRSPARTKTGCRRRFGLEIVPGNDRDFGKLALLGQVSRPTLRPTLPFWTALTSPMSLAS